MFRSEARLDLNIDIIKQWFVDSSHTKVYRHWLAEVGKPQHGLSSPLL